jgi:hypothetical protein
MTTLREAREQGKLDRFIAEREAETGDREAMDKAISSMAGKGKRKPAETPE